MGLRLTTPSSSIPASSTETNNQTNDSNSSTNANHIRANLNETIHRHRLSNNRIENQELFLNQNRLRTTSNQSDSLRAAPFNFNLLRYVGLEHESDDQSSDDNSPQLHRRLPHLIFTFRDVHCPVCNKTIPHDIFEKHISQCLSKPRIDYNDDILTENKGECVICLEDLLEGEKIARLPCLCIYHKNCIDQWFRVNRTCPEHPGE